MYDRVGNTGRFRSFPFLLFSCFGYSSISSVSSLVRYCHFDHFIQNNRKTKSWVDWSKKAVITENPSNQPVQSDGKDFSFLDVEKRLRSKPFGIICQVPHQGVVTCSWDLESQNLGGEVPITFVPNKLSTFFNYINFYPTTWIPS